MAAHWKPRMVKIILWLATEAWLNSIGLDTLATCGEFVFNRDCNLSLQPQHRVVALVIFAD